MTKQMRYTFSFWCVLAGVLCHSAAFANPTLTRAPDFTLTDTAGKTHTLSEYRGKLVIIEFFNPDCPFIKRAHRAPQFKALIETSISEDVVWLAVNSNRPGSQGAGIARNREAIRDMKLPIPILMDPTGMAGRAYKATRTPEVVLIGKEGQILYQGAVDSSGGSRFTTKPVRHWLQEAIVAYRTSRAVTPERTTPWGCTIKY